MITLFFKKLNLRGSSLVIAVIIDLIIVITIYEMLIMNGVLKYPSLFVSSLFVSSLF